MEGVLYTAIPDQRNSINPWSSFSRKEVHDNFDLFAQRQNETLAYEIVSVGFTPNGTRFEPQRAS